MPSDKRDLLDVLRGELEFLEEGGYRHTARQPWRATLIFEDSPTCPNYGLMEPVYPCSECVLIGMVPESERERGVPCNHIVLDAEGDTLASLYCTADQEETEAVLKNWLRKTIRSLEEERKHGAGKRTGDMPADASEPSAAKCANPFCAKSFDADAGGKYFVFHQRVNDPGNPHHVKHYWLCRSCSHVFTLVEDREHGPVVTPRWPESHGQEDVTEANAASNGG